LADADLAGVVRVRPAAPRAGRLGAVAGLWYPIACIVVPCALGLLMYLAFDVWDRRRRRVRGGDPLPLIDYYI
jgi:hypothetical protein